MAFWCRRIAEFRGLCTLLPRHRVGLLHAAHPTAFAARRVGRLGQSFSGATPACGSPLPQLAPIRWFASAREKEPGGTRTNEEIDAEYVRLVTDEGHEVVTRWDALNHARKLGLDLVEVQREADPPVCKIMDFHKEKFKKKTILKERAKAKSETCLRKAVCKEVKFTGKIENKDLEMKAETVKRLMERGYRVKIIAEAGKRSGSSNAGSEGSGSSNAGSEDLSKVLSRLYSLIEDVSAMESPPLVKEKMAYLIVRHAKFGTKKNPPKKATEEVEAKNNDAQKASTSTLSGGYSIRTTKSETEHFHGSPPSFHTVPASLQLNPQQTRIKAGPDIGKLKADYVFGQRNGRIPPASNDKRADLSPEISNRYLKSGRDRTTAERTPTTRPFVKVQDEGVLDIKQRYSRPDDFRRVPSPEMKENLVVAHRKHEQSPSGPRSLPTNFGAFSNHKSDTITVPLDSRRSSESASNKGVNPQSENRERNWGVFSR